MDIQPKFKRLVYSLSFRVQPKLKSIEVDIKVKIFRETYS